MKKLFWISMVVLLSGCAREVQKELVAVGGSKADGVVELGYDYDPELERPVTDPDQGKKVALKRCEAWGYKDVEEFQKMRESCAYTGLYGVCRKVNAYIQYQCLDEQDKGANQPSALMASPEKKEL